MTFTPALVADHATLKLNGELWIEGKPRKCDCNPSGRCNRKLCKTFRGPQKLALGTTGFELCDCTVEVKVFVRETEDASAV